METVSTPKPRFGRRDRADGEKILPHDGLHGQPRNDRGADRRDGAVPAREMTMRRRLSRRPSQKKKTNGSGM